MTPFEIKDCVLSSIATGIKSQVLTDFKEQLQCIPTSSIYYHFWGRRLRPEFEDQEHHNDFAIWARDALHDPVLAERLDILDPTEYPDLEQLREEMIEIVDRRLGEREWIPWAERENAFQFVRSTIIVFDTKLRLESPEDLSEILPKLSVGSVFYHFIDARRRLNVVSDDFSNWMVNSGSQWTSLIEKFKGIDPYFRSIGELKRLLVHLNERHRKERSS